jgi:hypothetical protein
MPVRRKVGAWMRGVAMQVQGELLMLFEVFVSSGSTELGVADTLGLVRPCACFCRKIFVGGVAWETTEGRFKEFLWSSAKFNDIFIEKM